MKKASEAFPEGKYDNSEISRRLYRGVVDAARRLEERVHNTASLQDLLGPEVTTLRTRLKDYCERLIFAAPLEYGKKAEELMWRKVYYDVVQQYKLQKKKPVNSVHGDPLEESLQHHLLAGIGNYHHLILRVQMEFHINLDGHVDVPFFLQQRGITKERWKRHQELVKVEEEVLNWSWQACHRFLICLGDLARYLSELGLKYWNQLAERYYHQALSLNPTIGMPHNQLGTLANNSGFRCDGAYHYLRCLQTEQPFEGAEGNLSHLFEKNKQTFQELSSLKDNNEISLQVRSFIVHFLKVCEQFYNCYDENIQALCEDTLQNFMHCFPFLGEHLTPLSESDLNRPTVMSFDLIFKTSVMSLMCIDKLQQRGSTLVSAATAFTLALFSHLLNVVFQRLHSSLCPLCFANNSEPNIEPPAPVSPIPAEVTSSFETVNNVKKKNFTFKKRNKRSRLQKLRRRRKISNTSQDDSDHSEESDLDPPDSFSSESETEQEDEMSDTGDCSTENQFDSSTTNDVQNGPSHENSLSPEVAKSEDDYSHCNGETTQPVKKSACHPDDCISTEISAKEVLQLISMEGLMCSIKVLTDWLKNHPDIVTTCAETSRSLWLNTVSLLNLLLKVEQKILNGNDSTIEKCREFKINCHDTWKQEIPLAEDIALQHLPALGKAHKSISFALPDRLLAKTPAQQAFLRMQCILHYGYFIALQLKSGITFDAEKNKFEIRAVLNEVQSNGMASPLHLSGEEEISEAQKKQLMRNMAHLWLKEEVRELEVEVRSSPTMQLSPYVVPDTSVLCHHLLLLKQLISTKRFIVIIPSLVISNLDYLKRESVGAREAIRWLETELRRGSRYIRAQKPQEKLTLSPIKYPKKKDKDSWSFFQILECCNYLERQVSQSAPSKTMVTLLCSSPNHLPPNAAAFAETSGINMENIEEFVSKWQTSSKSQG